MKKDNYSLNKEEKTEIVTDVKAAFEKARKSSNITYKNIERENKQRHLVFICVITIILISCGSIYWYLSSNPKTIFTRSVDVVFESLTNLISFPESEISEGTVDIDYKIKPIDKYVNQNKYNFKINYTFDSLNNILKNTIKTTYDGNKLPDFITYKNQNDIYFYSEDLANGYIKLDNVTTNFIYNKKNIKSMLKSINTAFIHALDGQKFKGSTVNLEIDGKNIKTKEASIYLTKENIDIILDNIANTLKNDTRFINSYGKVFNVSKEYIPFEIDKTISNLKSRLINTNNLTINIYTKGIERDFVKIEFIENEKNDIFGITKLDKNKYQYLLNKTIQNKKEQGIITIKKPNYKINIKRFANKTLTLDANINIKGVNKEINKMAKENTNNNLNYNNLSTENKMAIDQKLEPLETLINIILNK